MTTGRESSVGLLETGLVKDRNPSAATEKGSGRKRDRCGMLVARKGINMVKNTRQPER